MIQLDDIAVWSKSFGLLPVQLSPTGNRTDYIMLNGGYGDFCLQLKEDDRSTDEYYSKSWSSNTKNFVSVEETKVKIFNWNKQVPEEIDIRQIASHFDKFYSYLLSQSYKSERDIVPFVIDIFKQLRNITREKSNPVEALNLLFVLLTSIDEDIDNYDFEKWGILKSVTIPSGFDYYVDLIRTGLGKIKPDLDLIIRHSSGSIFQEAQKEVIFFYPQRDLFGGVSSKLNTIKKNYSSVHYTPQYIARSIVENVLSKVDFNKNVLKIFDPACGSSEFLIEALKQLKQKNFSGTVQVEGWDNSQTAIDTSNFLLSYEKRTVWKDKLVYKINKVEDSLLLEWGNDYDIILMNPPFVSWEQLGRKSREAVRQTLGFYFSGRPNQVSAFFYRAIQSLNITGNIGCIIPTSLLTLDAYQKMRKDLIDQFTISVVGKLGNFVFEDALTDVSLIIGHKPISSFIPTVIWTKNEKGIVQEALRDFRKMSHSNEFTASKKDYSIYKPVSFPIIVDDNWRPVSIQDNELLKRVKLYEASGKLVKIKNVFSVKQGINTGNNNLFKISKAEYDELPPQEKSFFRLVIDSKAVRNGQLFKLNYVWYPYDKKGLVIKTEDSFSENAPFYYKKLLPYRDELSKRSRKSASDWWQLSEYRAWLLEKEPRLFSARFGNSESFAFDSKGDFVVENGNAWIPKKDMDTSDFYFYLALFSSPFFDKLLSIFSKQLAGGNWYDLGGKYTNDIPIPNVHDDRLKNSIGYLQLSQLGEQLSVGNTYVKNIADDILRKFYYPDFD